MNFFFFGGGGQVQYFAIGNLYRSKLTSSVHGRRNRVGGGWAATDAQIIASFHKKKKAKKKTYKISLCSLRMGFQH